jgi:hypothetical protein
MAEEASAAGAKVEYDAGGNRKLPPVGPWLNAKIAAHFAAAGVKATVKYIGAFERGGGCKAASSL